MFVLVLGARGQPATGRVLGRVEMDEDVTHHFDLDACVLTLKDQDGAMELFQRHGMPLTPLTIGKAPLKQGQVRYEYCTGVVVVCK
jgi:hypothetical protein